MDAEQQVPEAIGSTSSSHTQPPVASHLSLLPASSLFPFTQQSKITSSKEELQDERMRNGSFTMSQPLKMDGQKPGVLPSFIIHEESKESLSLESEDEEMINCDILIEEQEPVTVVQQVVGNEDKKKISFDEQNENEDEQHKNEHQQNENEDNQNKNEKQSPKNESTEELYVTQSNDGIDPHKNEDMRNEDTENEDTRNEDTGNEDTGNEDHDTRVEHEVGQNENEDIEIENLSTPNSPQQYQSKSHTKVPETISALTLDVITSYPLSLAAIDDSSLFRFTNPIPPLSKAEVLHTLSNEIITDGVEVPLVSYSTPPQWRCASTSPPCKRQKVLLPALSPLAGPTSEEEDDELDDGEATLFQALPKEGAKESVASLPGNASCSSRNSSHRNNDDKSDDCFTVPDDPVIVHEEEDITSFHSDIITNRDTKSDVNEEQSRRQLVVSPPMTKPVLKRGYLVDLIEPCQFNLSTPKLRLGLSKRNNHHKIQ